MRGALLLAAASSASLAHADGYSVPIDESPYDPYTCVDTTDVVGYRRCPAYGAWGENLLAPYVFVDVGVNVWHFTPPPPGLVAARTLSPTAPPGRTRLITYDERVGMGAAYGLYAAIDFELGGFASQPEASSALMLLASAGIQHRFGPVTLGAELTGGLLAYAPEYTTALSDHGVLEARARGDLWLTPWLTLDGAIGTSVLDDGWMFGLALGFHTHAYGHR